MLIYWLPIHVLTICREDSVMVLEVMVEMVSGNKQLSGNLFNHTRHKLSMDIIFQVIPKTITVIFVTNFNDMPATSFIITGQISMALISLVSFGARLKARKILYKLICV